MDSEQHKTLLIVLMICALIGFITLKAQSCEETRLEKITECVQAGRHPLECKEATR